ncbi:MAG: hypothetical protein AB7P17_15645, partial [Nitrospirales bacterium]
LFFWFILIVGGTAGVFANTLDRSVELPVGIHFLTPAGDDVKVGPGTYHVEAVESWLKLIPKDEGRASGVLLEATIGTHEENASEPMVRLKNDSNGSDVFHLAMLLTDGTGLEAVGTASGIRPRAINLAILTTPTGKTPTMSMTQRFNRSGVSNDKLAPLQPQGQKTCGPVHTKIPRSNGKFHKPAVTVFQNQLFLMAATKQQKSCKPLIEFCADSNYRPDIFVFNGTNWAKMHTTGLFFHDDSRPALATFQNRVHIVSREKGKSLRHLVLNGSQWERALFGTETIPNQSTKAPPSLAVLGGKLHMVHLGESSDTLWHSTFDGTRWTPNAPVPNQKSQTTPALVAEPSRIHMVYLKDDSKNLMHTQFAGQQWTTPFFVKAGRLSSKSHTTPALTYNGQIEARLQLMFPADGSSNLRSALYGIPDGATPRQAKWFDERNLLGLAGEKAVSAIFYQGCVHMVYQRNDGTLGHSTFAPEDVHPGVR